MLTPQEVTNVVFEKAVFGGYEIGSVDQFLNQLTKDYSALYRDHELLKNRVAAMAEKIEEYRENEDAMRLALLSAKKSAKELAEKGKTEPELSAAEVSAERKGLAAALKKEQAALQKAKEATAAYLARFREATAVCEAALRELYGEPIPEASEAPDAAAEAAAVPEAEEPDFGKLNFSQS